MWCGRKQMRSAFPSLPLRGLSPLDSQPFPRVVLEFIRTAEAVFAGGIAENISNDLLLGEDSDL